ncbi:dnaj subfamily c member 11 [Holotrichia oblita]|uniref:Dnaj subfamily c member 11 n=1 Tax=Holotrichia oblita TaxID=644536 RepID=A0ACB9TD99_HOLOL|nr:dnaj subfamily c member 11 [Holotrichia oblita]
MDFDLDNDSFLEEDYYTALNVPKNATKEEINNSYRRLSRLYHPDKHVDPKQKEKAEIIFNKVKTAYEILSDPHRRAIYDSLGVKGLETEGWEIVQRTRTPAEIRAEYEQLAEERAERKKQQQTNPHGAITVNINATDLFNPYDDLALDDLDILSDSLIPNIEVSGMSFNQSVEFPLTQKDTCTLSGQLHTQNGTGTGGINLKFAQYNFSIQVGLPHSYISMSYTKKLLNQELKLRIAIKGGTFGGIFEYGIEKRVSKHSNVSAAVAVGMPTGVKLKIRLTRANQVYSFPIHLCEEILPAPIFYATIVPVVVYVIVKKGFVEPFLKEQRAKEVEKQKQTNKTKLLQKKKEAQAAIELMNATYTRIIEEEEAKKGLIIVKALYGKIISASGDTQSGDSDEVLEVTVPLQCLVKDSKLVLHESSKSQLPGFFDPAVGEEKSLLVVYNYRQQLHEVTIRDSEALRIPKNSHKCANTT